MASSTDTGDNRFKLASVAAMLNLHPEAARRLGSRPLLIAHGEDDDVATIESVEPIYANAPGPKRSCPAPPTTTSTQGPASSMPSALHRIVSPYTSPGHDAS
jgi:hypothetical protein